MSAKCLASVKTPQNGWGRYRAVMMRRQSVPPPEQPPLQRLLRTLPRMPGAPDL